MNESRPRAAEDDRFRPTSGFTGKARRNGTSGRVRLRVVLGAAGRVSDITVLKGLPDGLTEQAVGVARPITFLPAEKDGRRVSQWVVIEYNFNVY
ncbi:MAG TPA: energy transducer TonB [Pyrinomonadaceae bacterium]|nr:energy transducer TonB [Pyrinomonadaceae bacterium]